MYPRSSSAYRSSIASRRRLKAFISFGETPEISRTGRFPGSTLCTSWNATPSLFTRVSSSRALYISDAVTPTWYSGRPSSDRHFPSTPITFDESTTWVCRSGSPVRLFDLFAHLVARHRPQRRHRLGRRERQVVPRHRLPFSAALAV